MEIFKYQGVNKAGESVDGVVEAVDQKAAVAAVLQRGHFVTEVANNNGGVEVADANVVSRINAFRSAQISSKEILNVLTQLSSALAAGLPILDALTVIREQAVHCGVQQLLDEIIDDLNSGSSLSGAMEKHPSYFRALECAIVRVGEVGGIIDQTMHRLVQILKREEKIKGNIKVALMYPMFVLFLGLVSVIFIVTFIMPKVIGALGDVQLPWPTVFLMWMGDVVKGYWWLLLGIAFCGIYGSVKYLISAQGKLAFDRFKLRVPLLGKMLIEIAVGRFSRTLGALAKGGVPILESLMVVRDTLGNEILAREVDEIVHKVQTGEALSAAIKSSEYFPPLLVQVTRMGEQTGDLDKLLFNAADQFETQADSAIEKFMAILPAILIVLLFVVIGFIVLAVLLPIMGMDMAPTR